MPLSALASGASAEVAAIRSADPVRLMKLGSLGVVPGVTLTLLQRWPAFIVAFGETQLSLDGAVVGEVWVRALT